MQFQYDANLTLVALRRWLVAQCYDSLLVSVLWLAALLWLQVPWAPFWALLAGVLQFIPRFGPLLALFGPAMAMFFSGAPSRRWLCFLASYAAIAMLDGLLIQPYWMHRRNHLFGWTSLLAPILLGLVFPFWGVLLAPLAVLYVHRTVSRRETEPTGQQFSGHGEGVVLPPEDHPGGDT